MKNKPPALRSILGQRNAAPVGEGCYSRLEITTPHHAANLDRTQLERQHKIYKETWSRKRKPNERTLF